MHGKHDPNAGTQPQQSARLFEGIKGTGGVARLLLLPGEGHAYTARESIMTVLAEQLDWLERHVKNRRPVASAKPKRKQDEGQGRAEQELEAARARGKNEMAASLSVSVSVSDTGTNGHIDSVGDSIRDKVLAEVGKKRVVKSKL